MDKRVVGLLVLVAVACGGSDGNDPQPEPACTESPCPAVVAEIPYQPVRSVDLLYLIDNSGTMAEEQVALLSSTSNRFLSVLASFSQGLPDIHVGVISTDLGSGPFELPGCEGDGDGGRLLAEPRFAGCEPPDDAYISDTANADGTRARNYAGALAETFSCIARLGTDGCGFEQPLEAMRRALDGSNPGNAGFLRADAWLHLVIVTDEDDCSVSDTGLFDPGEAAVEPLGPLSSFRCFEFGVVCDDDMPRAFGERQVCRPRSDSAYMPPVAEYVEFFRGLKSDPTRVLVSVVAGPASPVDVVQDSQSAPTLRASCQSSLGDASPAVRLQAFAESFPNRHSVSSICADGLDDATIGAARLLARVADDTPCLIGAVHRPAQCTVDERIAGVSVRQLPGCDAPDDPAESANLPCFVIAPDPVTCANIDTELAVQVFPTDRERPADTTLVVTCLVD